MIYGVMNVVITVIVPTIGSRNELAYIVYNILRFIPFMYTTDLLSVGIDKRSSIYYCTLNYNITKTEKCAVGQVEKQWHRWIIGQPSLEQMTMDQILPILRSTYRSSDIHAMLKPKDFTDIFRGIR
jgi:hypothetical protein